MPLLITTKSLKSVTRMWPPVIAMFFLTVLSVHATKAIALEPGSNELILDIKLEGERLGKDILGYQRGDKFFIALGELSDVLQFPISVDAAAGFAGGWFIREEREFALDMNEQKVIVGNRQLATSPSSIFATEGDLFVLADTLEEWFPLRFEISIRELSMNIVTDETLPLEKSLMRSSRKLAKPGFTLSQPELPLKASPYSPIGHRATDARITVSSSRSDDDASPRHRMTSSLLTRGDLAWMTSTLFLSGTEEDLNGARLTLERSEFDGPAGLNHVEIGDVVSTIGSGNRGIGVRGGTVERSATGRYADDTIDLEGNILPGWQVELYRNGVLLEFQEVGDDGRYQFLEIPLTFGENVFEFVFYGPFGESRRETVTHYLGPGMLGSGNIAYELSATQADQSVFNVAPPRGGDATPDTAIYNAKFNLGLTQNLSAGAGVKSYENSDQRLQDFNTTLNFTTAYFQLRTDYTHREIDYDQVSGSLRTRVKNVGLRTSYTEYLENDLAEIYREDNPRLWGGSFGSEIELPVLPINLSAGYLKRAQSESADGIISTTYRPTYSTRFSTNLAYSWVDSRELGNEISHLGTGGISVSTVARPWVLRSFLNYDIHPDAELAFGGVSGSLELNSDLSMNLDIERDFRGERTRYRAGYNWDFDTFRISPQMSYDSEERFLGLITISTNFATRPENSMPLFDRFSQANHGGVLARAFLDADGDGQFDENERALPGVDFHAQQSFRMATSDKQGRAYLNRLSAYRQTDIRMDVSTLPDAEQKPRSPGNSVLPRPGHWDIMDFPVVVTSELEGRVQSTNSAGLMEPVSRVQVFLRNSSGEIVSSQRTAYDGLFIFADVPPGTYTLTLDENMANRIESAPEPIAVTTRSDYYQNLNFLIMQKEQSSIAAGQAQSVSRDNAPMASSERLAIDPPKVYPSNSPTALPTDSGGNAAEAEKAEKAGDWMVQVGAYSSESAARAAWSQLQKASNILRNLEWAVAPAGDLQRLLAGPSMEESEARQICQELSQEGIDCLVRRQP